MDKARWKLYFEKAKRLPMRQALLRGAQIVSSEIHSKFAQLRDGRRQTYSGRFQGRLQATPIFFGGDIQAEDKALALELADLYCRHYVDLLGSGWTAVGYGMKCRGVEGISYQMSRGAAIDEAGEWLRAKINPANFSHSKEIWQNIQAPYVPIDWQLDFKSGYRWSERAWYRDILYGHMPGADVKVPWELARMQHLSMLACAYCNAGAERKATYQREFCNQILDFIALNPPRFGVNWRCTMDVGIRAANWLMAYDIFKAGGAKFGDAFERILAESIYEHGIHIIGNLEYSPRLRSNHYLSNIAGLLFVAVHLGQNAETDAWLMFAVQEIIEETRLQFHEDGSNFEGSASYHRLSTEIVLYAAILCLTLSDEKKGALTAGSSFEIPRLRRGQKQEYDVENALFFPEWFWRRLGNAVLFAADLTKPDGNIAQIGDNDSGRFLKLWPNFEKLTTIAAKKKYLHLAGYAALPEKASYYNEVVLDHSHLLRVAAVLFQDGFFYQRNQDAQCFETKIVAGLLRAKRIPWRYAGKYLARGRYGDEKAAAEPKLENILKDIAGKFGKPLVYRFGGKHDLRKNLYARGYQGMGVYIYRSDFLFLAVRCGEVGQRGNGGHCHNDQLSVELSIDGENIICDPGSYVYTPFPELRNRYRATQSHFTVLARGKEQNPWLEGRSGLFSLREERTKAECLYFGGDGIVMRHHGYGESVYRVIQIQSEQVVVFDFGRDIVKYEGLIYFSDGYGRMLTEKVNGRLQNENI